jgi:two-component system, OmpR family, phosphate regulon sensor histidine kinase PhoR
MTELSPSIQDILSVASLRAEQLMSEPENPWLKVLRKMGDGVLLVESGGHLTGANSIMRDWLGKNLEALKRAWNKKTAPFSPADQWQSLREALESTMATTKSGAVELSFPVAGSGTLSHFSVTTVVLEDEPNGSTCVAVFRDISTIKRTEKMRRDFVANVSHELRTPLSVLKGYAETLLDGALLDPNTSREFITVMEQHANRLSRLVEELLDLSRLEADDYKMELSRLWLSPVVGQVCMMVKEHAAAKNITLDVALPANLPKIMGHPASLEQVIYNLVENAIKYSPPGKQVMVDAVHDPQRGVIVGIHDQGIGIEAKHIPRLFERFYRVDKARSREMGGTGLGLSIVKHIVQTHGGDIWVESEPGEGSHFYVCLKEATTKPAVEKK